MKHVAGFGGSVGAGARCPALVLSVLVGAMGFGLVGLGVGTARADVLSPPRIDAAPAPRVDAAASAGQTATGDSAVVSTSYTGCWGTGPVVTDFRGVKYSTRYCHNYLGGNLRLYTTVSGYLYAGNNWFVCQSRFGENPPVGSAWNNIWLYTQGDVAYAYHGWGWFPATYVSGGTNYNPIPGLRWCGPGRPLRRLVDRESVGPRRRAPGPRGCGAGRRAWIALVRLAGVVPRVLTTWAASRAGPRA